MEIRRTNEPWTQVEADWLIVPVIEGVEFDGAMSQLDQALGGIVTRLKKQGDLTGKLAATVALRGITGIGAKR